jgi:hypothetical protein
VPAVYVVNSTADLAEAIDPMTNLPQFGPGVADNKGTITLRSAIQDANRIGGQSSISFAQGVTGTVWLTLNSRLDLNADITIDGGGNTVERPLGAGVPQFNLFENHMGKTSTLNGLTLINGDDLFGGAIENEGTLTTQGLLIHDNHADLGGGGIMNTSTGWLWVYGGRIWNNDAGTSGGGGIENDGNVGLSGVSIDSNFTEGGGGGGIINITGAFCNTLAPVNISNNRAMHLIGNMAPDGFGGGVYNQGSFFMNGGALGAWGFLGGNQADSDGGGIYSTGVGAVVSFTGVSITQNNAIRDGGGFYLNSGSLTLDSSTISGNVAGGPGNGGVVNAANGANYVQHPNNTINDIIIWIV